MAKEEGFKLERNGALEYVIVRCPLGHCLRGMKTGDFKVRQDIACPECKRRWTVIAPATNGFEAYV